MHNYRLIDLQNCWNRSHWLYVITIDVHDCYDLVQGRKAFQRSPWRICFPLQSGFSEEDSARFFSLITIPSTQKLYGGHSLRVGGVQLHVMTWGQRGPAQGWTVLSSAKEYMQRAPNKQLALTRVLAIKTKRNLSLIQPKQVDKGLGGRIPRQDWISIYVV